LRIRITFFIFYRKFVSFFFLVGVTRVISVPFSIPKNTESLSENLVDAIHDLSLKICVDYYMIMVSLMYPT